MTNRPVTTDDSGVPAPSDDHSLSVGPNGPLLLQDHYLIQKMAHFNRERVPERAAADYRFNPFDLTKVWPHSDYPEITIGRFALHPRQLRRPHGRPDPARGRALPRHGRAPAASRHDRAHMISNIDGHASAPEVTDAMKKRVVEYWTNIHKDLGHGVSQGLALS